jgi:hypothetical protein
MIQQCAIVAAVIAIIVIGGHYAAAIAPTCGPNAPRSVIFGSVVKLAGC